jgi:hypothetical protein
VLIARQAQALQVAAPLRGAVEGVRLSAGVPLEQARLRGWLAFEVTSDGASLAVDATLARRHGAIARSLSATLMVTRACHEILLIDLFSLELLMTRDLELMADTWNRAVAKRFEAVEGVRCAVSNLKWDDKHGTSVEATLELTVPARVATGAVVLKERVFLRIDRG